MFASGQTEKDAVEQMFPLCPRTRPSRDDVGMSNRPLVEVAVHGWLAPHPRQT
jgi:hypothetical protein